MAVVRELWRYPVKSMAGERLDSCLITAQGLEGDRRWAFVDGTPNRAGKLLGVKQHAELLTYLARLADGAPQIGAPDGATQALGSAVLERLEAESGRQLGLRDQPGANFDDAHVHIVNLASVDLFSLEAGMRVDHRRFRANLYVDGIEPEEEVRWVGRHVRAGDAELEVVDRCVRCVVITRDPDTAVASPELLQLLVERHEECMGVYCQVVRPGRVALGDFVGPN